MAEHDDLGFVPDQTPSPSNNHDDLGFVPDNVHLTPSDGADSSIGAFIRGGLNTASAGFSDIGASGLNAAGDTAVDAVKGNVPQKGDQGYLKNLLDQYMKNYHQEKGQAEADTTEAKDAHPVLYHAGQFAGAIGPGAVSSTFKAVGSAPLLAKIATGAGLGALDGYGSSSQDNTGDQNLQAAKNGAIIGAAGTAAGETVVNPLLKFAGNKAIGYLQNQPVAKQIAATIMNATKGGSLFGEAGTGGVTDQGSQLTKDTADAFTDNVKAQTQKMAQAFKQSEGSTITPKTADLGNINTAKEIIQGQNPGAFEEQFNDLQNGQMNPQDANNFRTQLKAHINDLFSAAKMQANPNLADTAQKLKDSGLIGSLESMSADAGTDIAGLNKNISQAKNPLEAFLQKSGDIIPEDSDQWKYANGIPLEKQSAVMQNTLNRAAKNAGKGTNLGDNARSILQKYQQVLEKAKTANPDLNINPTQAATDLQNQAYLNAAKQNVNGIKESKFDLTQPIDLVKKVLNPYKVAEWSSKFKGVQDISKTLLSPSPLDRLHVTQSLYSNPNTSHLADQYLEALNTKNQGKLNNVVFQMMQNPEAKKAMGLPGAEDQSNNNQGGQ